MHSLALFSLLNIGISGGLSLQTVSPQMDGGVDYQYRVYNALGRDLALSLYGNVTEKLRFHGRLHYTTNSVQAYHFLRTGADRTQTQEGIFRHSSLGLALLPEWHKGERTEWYYGAGLYGGILVDQGFTGSQTYQNDDDTRVFYANDDPDESFRNFSAALVLTTGLRFPLHQRLKLTVDADVWYYLQAKNWIFEDTGTVNELNLRLGMVYTLRVPVDNN